MKPHESDKPEKAASQPSTISIAIDASFQADARVRQALTENLKPLRAESDGVTARLQKAFEKFDPSNLSAEERALRHYVAPGADPSSALDTVIMNRVNALRTADRSLGLTLRDTAELRSLIKADAEPRGSRRGVVDLGELIGFLDRKSTSSSLTADSGPTPFTAEIEADRLLDIAEGKTDPVTERFAVAAVVDRDVAQLVADSVNVQMGPVTAPESPLSYGKIPNGSNDDTVQRDILQTFELRPGASDVTAYHDFHTLQIAFQHVWSRIFDGQLTSLGRDLYREYVRLKDFSGSPAPDLQVGTLADLRRLIDEIKKLSQFVDDETPAGLRPAGSEQKTGGLPTPTPEDVVRGGVGAATGGVSLFIEWAFNELIQLGNRPVRVTWTDFPLKFNEGRGNIIELGPPEINALPQGTVEIILETDTNSYKKKISFQQWDRKTQRAVYSVDLQNFGGGHGPVDRLVLNFAQVQDATLKFISEDEIVNELLLGRYVLGDLTTRLQDRTRLTFRWKGQR